MDRIIGILLIAVSAVGFGTLAILGRYAYAAGIDTLTILSLRFLLATPIMAALLISRREPMPRGRALLWSVAMGAIGYVGQAFCYLSALKYASAGLVALLLYLYPVFVTVFSGLILRERVTGFKMLLMGVALVGIALTVGPGGGQLPGIVLAVLAAVIYSCYIIVGSRVMRQLSAVQSSMIIFASAGAMSSVLMVINGPHPPVTMEGWVVVASIVLVATVVPVVTFLAGMERIGPTNASMLSTLEPVVTVLLAASLFGETLPPVTLLGGSLILASVIMLARSEFRQPERMAERKTNQLRT
jgi:drug/metabolite transporter (DMT)-like permease